MFTQIVEMPGVVILVRDSYICHPIPYIHCHRPDFCQRPPDFSSDIVKAIYNEPGLYECAVSINGNPSFIGIRMSRMPTVYLKHHPIIIDCITTAKKGL